MALSLKNKANIIINNLDDAKKYKVGAQLGGASESFLKTNNFKNIDLVTNQEFNIQKLNSGRIDLWYTNPTVPKLATVF